LLSGETVEYALGEGRYGYLVPASGAVEVNGLRINARDGGAIKDVAVVRITATVDSEVVRSTHLRAKRRARCKATANELELARYQGHKIAETASKLHG
jgi:hypothetical protein